MAVVLDSPVPATPPPTLLSTLKAIVTLHSTRRSLLAELDLSLSSFLSPSSSSSRGTAPDALSAPSDPDFPTLARTGSSCQGEALNPPPPRSDAELQELLRIAFGGLVEVKEEVAVLQGALGERFGPDGERLEACVEKVEGWESERVKAVRSPSTPGRQAQQASQTHELPNPESRLTVSFFLRRVCNLAAPDRPSRCTSFDDSFCFNQSLRTPSRRRSERRRRCESLPPFLLHNLASLLSFVESWFRFVLNIRPTGLLCDAIPLLFLSRN